MELTKTQQYWKSHVDALESFEGSAADYARQHDLEAKKLYVYKTAIRARLESQEATSGFVRVTTSSTASISSGVTAWLPNGVRLSLPGLESGMLERLARL